MDSKNSNVDELIQFIDDTRQGKYNEDTLCIEQMRDIRCDYQVIEDINRASESVMLYGLSF